MDKQDTKAHLFPLSSQQAYTAVQSIFEFAFLLLRNNPSLAANDLFFCPNKSTLKGVYLRLPAVHSY